MSAERDPIEDLLASISDGRPVDWDRAVQGASPATRPRLEALRDVSRIAEFNRGLQTGGAEDAGRWGDMLLLERIGGGAHAEVYRAWDPGLRREVALKLLRSDGDGEALLAEGRAAARIRHAHVVTMHGIDRRDGRVGLWMELVPGPDLEHEVRTRAPFTPAEAARLGVEMGMALAAVHAAGLLHRDVKPANVVRDAEGRHVLADFGLGLRWDQAALATAPTGTPMYMAPELLAGAAATERSDVYSLGMLMWFALTGRHPFEMDSLAALTAAAARGPRPALLDLRPETPAGLAEIVERAVAPDPVTRFGSAREVVETLEAWTSRPAPPPRRAATPVLALALAALAIAAFVLWRGLAPRPPAGPASPPAAVPAPAPYAIEASLLGRAGTGATRLVTGDRVRPGDRISLEVRASTPTWLYVLNEDERGERYLLFPQPRLDLQNPLAADSGFVLPGPVGGRENAWTVTSAGGRETFLIVASPEPLAELEADLARLPAPQPGRPVTYAPVGEASVERLRGVGGVSPLPEGTAPPAPRASAFDRFRALAGRETGVRGVWVRQVVLENPGR